MAGTQTRPRGSPGQHARLWASKRRLLLPPFCTASGGPDFRGQVADFHGAMAAQPGGGWARILAERLMSSGQTRG